MFRRSLSQSRDNFAVFAVLTVLLSGACGGGDSNRTIVTDSAGVTVVHSFEPMWSAGKDWRLTETPTVDIGVVEGDPQYQLHNVTGLGRFGDGTIVLANAGSQEVRWYDRQGTYLRSAGGEGGGPGEFENLYSIAVRGDSVFAFDIRNFRITVFDRSGSLVRTATIGELRGVMLGMFGDGSFLVTDSDLRTHLQRRMAQGIDEIGDGYTRIVDVAMRYAATGEFIDSLGSFPGTEGNISVRARGEVVSVGFGIRSFGRKAVFAPFNDGFCVGTQDSYDVDMYDVEGQLVAKVRRDHENAPVTAADIKAFGEWVLAETGVTDKTVSPQDVVDEATTPETMPAHGAIMVDSDGNLWVQDYRYDGDHRQPRWAVFGRDYGLLGTVDMPHDFQVREIGSDYVLGVWKDNVDVEHAQVYGIMK